MIIIETKRHPLKFYGLLAFSFLFFFALASFMVFTDLDTIKEGDSEMKQYVMPIFGVLIYFVAIWMIYVYWKNSPKVTIYKDYLKIGTETFYLKNIKDVALTGKMPFRFIGNFPMEGTAILFNDDTEKFLFDDMYTNSNEVKSFLEQVILNKQEFKSNSTKKINKNEIRFENAEIFKGNQFTSLRGISIWVLIGFSAFLAIGKLGESLTVPIGLLIFLAIFWPFWFFLNSLLMNYFALTKDFLIVKNHNLIWKEKIYRLSDIKEVVFETQGNQPYCMRVITNDFKNKLYPAGTLRDSKWLEMKRKLEIKGVVVRNECVLEK